MTQTKLLIRLTVFFFMLSMNLVSAQNKYEREHRIRKSQFPKKALEYIEDRLKDAKSIRFYKEIDSAKISYEAKLKKERLRYSIEFNEEGILEDVELLIKPVDIPEDALLTIHGYLKRFFSKYRIRKMQQQYPTTDGNPEKTLRDAFQNLLLPTIKYELVVSGKKDREFQQFQITFDAEGNFEKMRRSLPANYDHVLY